MLHVLAGEPDVPLTPIPFGHAEPHGVYADDQETVPAEMASLIGKIAGAMITCIAADVHRHRATPPTIANTDGDPMRLEPGRRTKAAWASAACCSLASIH